MNNKQIKQQKGNEKKTRKETKCRPKKDKKDHIGSKFNFYFPTAAISNTNASLRLNKTKKSYLQIKESQGVSKKLLPRTDLRSYI